LAQCRLEIAEGPYVAQFKPDAILRFLMLTTYDTDEHIGPALAAGARGYLLKDALPDELARGVRACHGAGRRGAGARGRGAPAGSHCQGERGDELSERELDVLRLLIRRLSCLIFCSHYRFGRAGGGAG
jgi:DNA-binding NarL/FixJ family response regulator